MSRTSRMRERHESGPLPPEARMRIAVSGSGVCETEIAADAEAVGRALAEADVVLLTGGRTGVMEAACRGAHLAGGMSVGFLPGGQAEEANPWVTVPVPTGMGQGRNILVARSADALIAIAGGWGTLSEIALARKLEIPVVLLRPTIAKGLGLPIAESPQEAVTMAIELGRSRRAPGVAH
ncbi:MAG TPA: TIGR00725 family protein [Longimicrobiales bacterium]|nr:TIGR00725 family protein [Longimicrobiales bacterium]